MTEELMKTAEELSEEITQIEEQESSKGYVNLENFEPGKYTEDLYNSKRAMERFEYAHDAGKSGAYAQIAVIEEILKTPLLPNEVIAYAQDHGWYSEETGYSSENMTGLLDLFDIQNAEGYDKTYDDLMYCLENGGRAIVEMDSAAAYGETPSGSGMPDLAVEVIGYDEVHDAVIVNDFNNPNGAGELIPREQFIEAWENSGGHLIECYRDRSDWVETVPFDVPGDLIDWDKMN